MKRILVFLAFMLAACGGDSSGPSLPQVAGTYSLSQSNIAGSGISCNALGTTMTLTQNGGTFSGTYSGGTLTCTGPGGQFSDAVGNGAVANGTINENGAVAFDLDTQDWHLVGNVSGTSMSGTATVRLNVTGSGAQTFSGNWSAARR
ncbi:MAG TPA: hypothetical protein VFG68_22815 [Fimbriiglobus sp.]|nr:hypothetical protein [Fimbriiglobus sp.]